MIDKETFQIVQNLLKQKSFGVTEYKTEHLLGGLLVCGECGMPITFRVVIKPTPSIAKEQDSVNLESKQNVKR